MESPVHMAWSLGMLKSSSMQHFLSNELLHFFVDLLHRNGLANVDEIFQITYSGKGRMPVSSSPLPMSLMHDVELISTKECKWGRLLQAESFPVCIGTMSKFMWQVFDVGSVLTSTLPGFKIASVLTQHLVHNSFNIDATPNATSQVLILTNIETFILKLQPYLGRHEFKVVGWNQCWYMKLEVCDEGILYLELNNIKCHCIQEIRQTALPAPHQRGDSSRWWS